MAKNTVITNSGGERTKIMGNSLIGPNDAMIGKRAQIEKIKKLILYFQKVNKKTKKIIIGNIDQLIIINTDDKKANVTIKGLDKKDVLSFIVFDFFR